MASKFKIYTLTDDRIWYLHYVNRRSMEELSQLYRCSYRLRLNTTVPYNTGRLMKKIRQGEILLNLTGYIIQPEEIIEMDDGHIPVFFYVQEKGIRRIHIEKAEKNPCGIQELYVSGESREGIVKKVCGMIMKGL